MLDHPQRSIPAPAKVALVTGGAVRVGRAIVRGLSEAGFAVVIHHFRSTEAAADLEREIGAQGRACYPIAADLTRPGAPADLVARAIAAAGRLDVLVNNAAVLCDDERSAFDLARMKLLNVDAPRKCTVAAVPHLAESSGAVVHIADVAGIQPFEKHKAYSRTKLALIEEAREEALRLAPRGIRVNAVCPGTVLVPKSWGSARAGRLVKSIPLGRIGRPEDVAGAVVFLATADFVTGQIIAVDGGRTLAALSRPRLDLN